MVNLNYVLKNITDIIWIGMIALFVLFQLSINLFVFDKLASNQEGAIQVANILNTFSISFLIVSFIKIFLIVITKPKDEV